MRFRNFQRVPYVYHEINYSNDFDSGLGFTNALQRNQTMSTDTLTTTKAVTKESLKSLDESLKLLHSEQYPALKMQLRDSVIRRFRFTIDIYWRLLREYLENKHSITFGLVSPREVLEAALTVNVLKSSEFELFENMLQDRNLTSHTYNEFLAEEISGRIDTYYLQLKQFMERVSLD